MFSPSFRSLVTKVSACVVSCFSLLSLLLPPVLVSPLDSVWGVGAVLASLNCSERCVPVKH